MGISGFRLLPVMMTMLAAAGLVACDASNNPSPRPSSGDSEMTLRGDVQFKQSDGAYECVGYGSATMRVASTGGRVNGSFASGSLQNDPGCSVSAVQGTWSGVMNGNGLTVRTCSVNGTDFDSFTAYGGDGELDVNCSRSRGGILYEVNFQVKSTS